MVAQRSSDDPGSAPDFDDPPESLLRTGDAAALVPVAERDGTGVRQRRRARFVEAARPQRPGRHSGWRPAPRPEPGRGQNLSRIAGFVLAIVVVAGLAFTVVRSQGDSPAAPVGPAAAPVADESAAATAAETAAAEATPIPAPLAVDPTATLDRPSTPFPDDLIAPPAVSAADGAVPTETATALAGAAATAEGATTPATSGDPDAAAIPGNDPVTVAPTSPAPQSLLDDAFVPPVPVVEPFAGYELPVALQEWAGTVVYLVQPGDLLGTIALNNRTTSAAIAGVNNLTDTVHLRAGETLLVPVGYVEPVTLPAVDPVTALFSWIRLSDYTVQPGDSLAAIADLFLTSAAAIVLLNDFPPGAAPVPGVALIVPWGFTLDVGEAVPAP